MNHHNLGLFCLFGLASITPAADPQPPVKVDQGSPQPAMSMVPQLSFEHVEAMVLNNFPDLQAASAIVDAALGERKSARLPPDPSLELGRVRTRPLDGSPSGSNSFQGVEWELPMPWRYVAGRRFASANLVSARAGYSSTELEVRSRIRGLIVELAAAEEKVALLEEQLRMAEGLSNLAASRKELGEGRELDRLRTHVETAGVARELELARADREGLRATLVRLSGGRLPADFMLAERLSAELPQIDAPELEQHALAASPQLRKFAADADAADSAVGVARGEASPSLALTGGRAGDLDTRSTSISVILKVPLWNANRGAIATAIARRAEARARVEGARRELGARTSAAASRYGSLLAVSRTYSAEVLPAAGKARDISDFAYRHGEISLIEALDARRAYQSAALESLETRRQLHLSRIDLESFGALPIPPLTRVSVGATPTPTPANPTPEAPQ